MSAIAPSAPDPRISVKVMSTLYQYVRENPERVESASGGWVIAAFSCGQPTEPIAPAECAGYWRADGWFPKEAEKDRPGSQRSTRDSKRSAGRRTAMSVSAGRAGVRPKDRLRPTRQGSVRKAWSASNNQTSATATNRMSIQVMAGCYTPRCKGARPQQPKSPGCSWDHGSRPGAPRFHRRGSARKQRSGESSKLDKK